MEMDSHGCAFRLLHGRMARGKVVGPRKMRKRSKPAALASVVQARVCSSSKARLKYRFVYRNLLAGVRKLAFVLEEQSIASLLDS